MELLKTVYSYWEAFLDLIFPPHCTCIFCKQGKKVNEYGICPICQGNIVFIEKGRWLQSREIYGGISCRMFSVFAYQGEVRRLIYRLKYSHETYLARELGKIMVDFIHREDLRIDLFMPIPLYKEKERERGFNQANLLTKYMSKVASVPNEKDNLIRNRDTRAMHSLDKGQRKANVKGAFTVKYPETIKDKHILLVDDILTTGATVEACIKVLLEAGARKVTVLTLARVTVGTQNDRSVISCEDNTEENIG